MRQLGRILSGAAVVAALGFGATQALAAPAGPSAGGERACQVDCLEWCISIGGHSGWCTGKHCLCVF